MDTTQQVSSQRGKGGWTLLNRFLLKEEREDGYYSTGFFSKRKGRMDTTQQVSSLTATTTVNAWCTACPVFSGGNL